MTDNKKNGAGAEGSTALRSPRATMEDLTVRRDEQGNLEPIISARSAARPVSISSGLTVEQVKADMDPWTFDEIVAVVVAYSGVLRGRTLDKQREKRGALGKEKGARPGAKAKPRKKTSPKT